jgi:hypothetical protein
MESWVITYSDGGQTSCLTLATNEAELNFVLKEITRRHPGQKSSPQNVRLTHRRFGSSACTKPRPVESPSPRQWDQVPDKCAFRQRSAGTWHTGLSLARLALPISSLSSFSLLKIGAKRRFSIQGVKFHFLLSVLR